MSKIRFEVRLIVVHAVFRGGSRVEGGGGCTLLKGSGYPSGSHVNKNYYSPLLVSTLYTSFKKKPI